MEELIVGVNWVAVLVGAIAAFALGALWYSPKMFGNKWAEGVGMDISKPAGPMMPAMFAQAVGTFLLAWVIGITERTDSIYFAILITFTIAALIKAGGFFSGKSKYAIMVESGFVIAMAVVMIAAHAIL